MSQISCFDKLSTYTQFSPHSLNPNQRNRGHSSCGGSGQTGYIGGACSALDFKLNNFEAEKLFSLFNRKISTLGERLQRLKVMSRIHANSLQNILDTICQSAVF